MNNDQNRDYGQPGPNPQHHFYVENEKENPIQDSSGNEEDKNQDHNPHHSLEDEKDHNSQGWNTDKDNESASNKGSGDSSIAAGTNPDRYSKENYNPAVDGMPSDDNTKDDIDDKDNPAFRTPGL